MKDAIYSQFANDQTGMPLLSVEILRDVLIPNLLGKDLNGITYWAGKDLARQFRLANITDLITFFKQVGWGTLKQTQDKPNQYEYTITGPEVARRLKAIKNPDFMLETGFLAEQTQLQINRLSEAEIVSQKRGTITIQVTIDQGQVVENNDPQEPLKIIAASETIQDQPNDPK